jgi:glycerophosphoryl diester phosphodiesterase
MPEHTLAAYQRAVEDGADALECDVRMTRDGHLVCVHDRRVDRTSTGRGPVTRLELADLDELDWGSWWGDTDDGVEPDSEPARHRVLTLERLCHVVADARRPVQLAIETKHPSRHAGRVERELVTLLARFGWTRCPPGSAPTARVMSMSETALRRVAARAPLLPTVLLLPWLPPQYRSGLLPRGTGIAGPSLRVLRRDPGYVARVHRHGGQVHVWTVDRDPDVHWCAELGVDALITNRPLAVRELLDR